MREVPSGGADRLAYLLKLVAHGPDRFSLGDLAARARLPASTVHRLLQVMVRAGLVERGAHQTYRPGREFYAMASQLVARFDVIRSARPLLEGLVERWHETAVLCTYNPTDRRATIADVVMTPHPLRFAVERGGEILLPWGSLGRAILAFLSGGEMEAIIRETRFGPLTGRPRDPRSELEKGLREVREEGVSRFYDPDIEIAGIAAPVFGAEGLVLGCIGVTMPSKRYLLHAEDDLVLAVREAGQNLSAAASMGQGGADQEFQNTE